MTVVTRFAPSPTGYLHIGGARTALYNYLFSKHHGGKFLLRIEDTDRQRSTQAATDAILDSLSWLGLEWDGDPIYQFARAERHVEVAKKLIENGNAYYCYATPEELEQMRAEQKANGKQQRYDRRWRDRDPSEAPEGVNPVIRLKMPLDGETVINDLVNGEVTIKNKQLDDMILVRADGTPTYMLSVVVDDHDMGITHVIRGNDHLNNAFRQYYVYKLMGWDIPQFVHIPLIHGPDGAKLSKRHGAVGAEKYRDMGYLPEALCNYLLKLGWGHGDDEIISKEQAIEWFDTDGIVKSPARMDFKKLENLNGHYVRESSDDRLVSLISPIIEEKTGNKIDEDGKEKLLKAMPDLKERAKTITELANNSSFYFRNRPVPMIVKKAKKNLNESFTEHLKAFVPTLEAVTDWKHDVIETTTRQYTEENDLKLGKVAQPIRAALTGSNVSPPIFLVMEVLGKDEVMARIDDAVNGRMPDEFPEV
jgi:glutamyl-tRNA synthetase